jgi:hypothetical protein
VGQSTLPIGSAEKNQSVPQPTMTTGAVVGIVVGRGVSVGTEVGRGVLVGRLVDVLVGLSVFVAVGGRFVRVGSTCVAVAVGSTSTKAIGSIIPSSTSVTVISSVGLVMISSVAICVEF